MFRTALENILEGVSHKCFLSYHHDDQSFVDQFVNSFSSATRTFIYRAVGVFSDDIINSNQSDYIMRRIREDYLSDSTVTIVMIGKCTWARKYVDWEISSTLRNDANNKRSGLMAIQSPSKSSITLPDRFADNWDKDMKGNGYGRFYRYPKTATELETWIEDAFQARNIRSSLIDNSRQLFGKNRQCE